MPSKVREHHKHVQQKDFLSAIAQQLCTQKEENLVFNNKQSTKQNSMQI